MVCVCARRLSVFRAHLRCAPVSERHYRTHASEEHERIAPARIRPIATSIARCAQAHSKQLAFFPRISLKAAIGCLDMAKAFYKRVKVRAGARKLQMLLAKTTKNRIAASATREKKFAKSADWFRKWSGLARAKCQKADATRCATAISALRASAIVSAPLACQPDVAPSRPQHSCESEH